LLSKNECSRTEQIGYKLEMGEDFNSRMIFYFMPRFKSHSIGDNIQYHDDVRLVNKLNGNNLAVSPFNFVDSIDLFTFEDNPYM